MKHRVLLQIIRQFLTGVSAQNILIIFQRIKVSICRCTSRQTVTVLDELDVAQTYRYTTVTIGIERVKIDADIAETAGVDHHRVNYRLDMTVNDLRRILAGGVQEKMLLIVLIIRAVDVSITQRKFQVRRELATPLAYLAIFLRCFDRLVIASRVFLSSFGIRQETEYFASLPLMLFGSKILAKEIRHGITSFVALIIFLAIIKILQILL